MNAVAALKKDRLAMLAFAVIAAYAVVALLVALKLAGTGWDARVGAKFLDLVACPCGELCFARVWRICGGHV